MIIMTGVILFTIDPWLAAITLLPLPFIAWMIHVVRDRLRTGFEKIDRVWGEVTNVLADTIPGIRVVKAFAQEDREANRFRTANKHNLAVNDKLNKIWSLFSPTVSFLTEIGLLVIWVFGIYQVSKATSRWGAEPVHFVFEPLLRPSRFHEPHRLRDAEIGIGGQAYLRHPRPRFVGAGTGQSGQAGQGRRQYHPARSGLPLR
jgi:ABC-type multidrug transport system fused ATPase/permease subunit